MREKNRIGKSTLRDVLAIDTAKTVEAGTRLFGHQGTSLPGKAAMKIAPSVLSDLAGQVRKKIFAVCGTNGKTTVNNLLCAMLEAEGEKTVCNRLGANMPAGVTAAFIHASGTGGKTDADYACIEVDEASAQHVFPALRPDYMILTNLFRDQLDRYGEIDITIELLEKAVRMAPDMKLIVNADDPLSVYLAEMSGHPYVTFGIRDSDLLLRQAAGNQGSSSGEVREGRFCKKCGSELIYAKYHYSQMGIWHCPACSFRRPDPDYEAIEIRQDGGLAFSVQGQDMVCEFRADLRGLYSVYNILAVWTALREGTDGLYKEELFNTVLRGYRPQFGRSEIFHIGGREVLLNLAKNPAGFNQNIAAMLEDRQPKHLIIAINDNDQDGTDVSWLWDVDFDRVGDESVLSVTVSGIRALDMCLRLKYVGIRADIAETPEKAVEEELKSGNPEKIYVLVNYTALFEAHQYLKNLEKNDGIHQRRTGSVQGGNR